VSMPPGTVANATGVVIINARTHQKVETAARDGGFDPVALTGEVGDTIGVSVGAAFTLLVVPASSPPIIVRSQPPRKKTDVPLNAALLVYFSEPVDGSSVTPPSIELLR